MLTMTVMQHERGPVGQLSTEAAEAEDVLFSRLRHLHHTLRECHRRVQLVDHALCAQGDKGHYDPQNQTGNDHNFEIQARKDCSLQKQAQENHSLQLETEDCGPQNEAGRGQGLEEQFRETFDSREQIEDDGLQKQPEKDLNCQREESENQSCEDYYYQKPSEDRHSLPTNEQKFSVQTEDDNIYDSDKNLFDYTRDDSDLSNLAMNDHILHNYAKKDNHIDNETKEENDIQNSVKNSCELDSTDPLEKKCKYLTRQKCIDMDDDDDSLPTGIISTLSSTMGPPNVDEISPVPGTMTGISEQHHQLTNLNVNFSKKISNQESSQKSFYVGEVKYGPDSMQDLGNKVCCEGDMDFSKNQKKSNAFQDDQQKSEEMGNVKYAGKVSPVDPSPEVARRMDVICEALENLQSHFLALHSSLVDSSSLFCSQKLVESSDNSYTTINENDEVAECGELLAMPDDHTKGFHQMASETTQLHQTLCEQRKLQVRHHQHCSCHNLSRNQISSHTRLEEPANSAALSNNSTHTRTYLRGWRESCLCIVMVVLLLLLLLFLACCLLLVLPVVSVSVRTAGGLPAF